ncbi:MAG: phosphatase PAP2 family protein [Myxococcales bacterium]|nr:phosphatase PAP2 family protein [Myxococcales bacterium]
MSAPAPLRPPLGETSRDAPVSGERTGAANGLSLVEQARARSLRPAAASVAAGLVAFVALGALVVTHPPAFDAAAVRALAAARVASLTPLVIGFTYTGGSVALALISAVVVIALYRTRRRAAVFFATAMLGGAVLNYALKLLFGRVRPVAFMTEVYQPTTPSFPSGHALGTMALALALWLVLDLRSRTARGAYVAGMSVFVVAIGLTRVYLGVHYPTDVLGGWLLGCTWVSGLAVGFKAVARSGAA